jgi:hypothetical protein
MVDGADGDVAAGHEGGGGEEQKGEALHPAIIASPRSARPYKFATAIRCRASTAAGPAARAVIAFFGPCTTGMIDRADDDVAAGSEERGDDEEEG